MADRQELTSKLRGYEKQLTAGVGGAVLFAVSGAVVFFELRDLEAGARESVTVWRPAAYLYESFGLWGAVSAFAGMAMLGVGAAVHALRARAQLTQRFGEGAVSEARRSLASGTPRFVRGTESDGRLPRSTIVLGVLLLLLLVAAAAGVKLGLLR